MTLDGEPRISCVKDGRTWHIGSAADVAWIKDGTDRGVAITSAIPPAFAAYATVVLPCGDEDQWHGSEERYERAVMTVLCEHSPPQPWWLGYLDTGSDDLVFSETPMVELYSQWRYLLVEAGPDQAAGWRRENPSFKGALPDLMFPGDRSWLLSTLWDDHWTCIGGPAALIHDVLHHPDLRSRARQVALSDEDVTPPGHTAR